MFQENEAEKLELEPEELAARWRLWRVQGVGYSRLMALIERVGGGAAALFGMGERARRALIDEVGFGAKTSARILAALGDPSALSGYAREVDALEQPAQLLSIWDEAYPQVLRELKYPPVFIYLRGSASALYQRRSVAVVGSRRASSADVHLTRKIAADLAAEGVCVVSGGALGIDAAAHQGALDVGGQTLAVLAGGVDRPTPAKNRQLFDSALRRGALLSEYPLGVRPRNYHFQRRNQLIAALGRATIVIRAGHQSGTMLTARAAAELDRPLCALPGAPDDPLTQGSNQLLVDGAWCVRNADDILRRVFNTLPRSRQLYLSSSTPSSSRSTAAPYAPPASFARPHPLERAEFSADAQALFKALERLTHDQDTLEVGRDRLTRETGWAEGRLSPALLELELRGAITKVAGVNAFRPIY